MELAPIIDEKRDLPFLPSPQPKMSDSDLPILSPTQRSPRYKAQSSLSFQKKTTKAETK